MKAANVAHVPWTLEHPAYTEGPGVKGTSPGLRSSQSRADTPEDTNPKIPSWLLNSHVSRIPVFLITTGFAFVPYTVSLPCARPVYAPASWS